MKRKSTLLIVLMMLASFMAGAENLRGDVDQDGRVNIADVTALIDYLLTNDATGISLANADSDLDGRVNIADVTMSIDYLLTSSWGDDPVTPPTDHEWVDLGLPSGTLWATYNVGAISPEDYGDYFAWGETAPKDYYDWDTYKWCNGSYYTLTKYCYDSGCGYDGFVDYKYKLDPEDDAAYVNWGPSWCMPTEEQQNELREKCTCRWTKQNGVNGRLFTGPNGNTLFLPAAGSRNDGATSTVGLWGGYWSSSLFGGDTSGGYNLGFDQLHIGWGGCVRCRGLSVRAVRVSQN